VPPGPRPAAPAGRGRRVGCGRRLGARGCPV